LGNSLTGRELLYEYFSPVCELIPAFSTEPCLTATEPMLGKNLITFDYKREIFIVQEAVKRKKSGITLNSARKKISNLVSLDTQTRIRRAGKLWHCGDM
jgi:hypothetical protein